MAFSSYITKGDPYFLAYICTYDYQGVVFHPLYKANNQKFLVAAQLELRKKQEKNIHPIPVDGWETHLKEIRQKLDHCHCHLKNDAPPKKLTAGYPKW